ncbi:hypothetical protein ACFX16_046912 [Malus domestica]
MRATLRIEEAFAFSKAELLKDHKDRSQKLKRLAFSKAGLLRDHEGRSQKSKRHLLFSALSAPVTCTLSFAEITGILLKISGEVEST